MEGKMKKTAIVAVLLGAVLPGISPLRAADISQYVSRYTSANGQKFMQPLGDAFGANLNSGWYHSAHISAMGLHFYLGLETMMATIGDKQKTFMATTEGAFSPQTQKEVPTIFGNAENVTVVSPNTGLVYAFPGGMNIKRLPLGVPQLTVGSIFGTEVSVRWAQYKFGEEIGKLSLTGFGIRHSLSQYIPLMPLDLAVGAFMQDFKVGDIVTANTVLIGVQGGYSLGMLAVYGGVGYEKARLKIKYESGNTDISFDLKAKNKVRMTVGAALNLIGVHIHADYNIATQNVLVLGAGIGL
jgi:hypothetical protein